MKFYQLFLTLAVAMILLVRDSWTYPQDDGAIRGRAVSSYNRDNDPGGEF